MTGDVPLNVSIQGGTYHYTPGYRINPPTAPFPGKKESDPYYSLQFATDGFASEKNKNDVQYNVDFHNGTITKIYEGNYDINAFASMFPKNAIITAEGKRMNSIGLQPICRGKSILAMPYSPAPATPQTLSLW